MRVKSVVDDEELERRKGATVGTYYRARQSRVRLLSLVINQSQTSVFEDKIRCGKIALLELLQLSLKDKQPSVRMRSHVMNL